MFLSQFPTDGSSNLRKPRSDIASVVKVIFSTYPSSRSASSSSVQQGKKGAAQQQQETVEDDEREREVDFSRMEEMAENEKVYQRVEERREVAGRLMGLVSFVSSLERRVGTLRSSRFPSLSSATRFVSLA